MGQDALYVVGVVVYFEENQIVGLVWGRRCVESNFFLFFKPLFFQRMLPKLIIQNTDILRILVISEHILHVFEYNLIFDLKSIILLDKLQNFI